MNFSPDIENLVKVSNKKFKLSQWETRLTVKNKTEERRIRKEMVEHIEEIDHFQNKLFAEDRQSLLIIFQGMDASGKDGAIKHIMGGINPQGVYVVSFKHPSMQELEHDYLWRHSIKLPEHGQIAIFNRSHYENVLISKVHPEFVLSESIYGIDTLEKVNKKFWKARYAQINNFEKSNIQTGTQILKFFLHISSDEQCKRFISRIDEKEKHWKFSPDDIEERKYWLDYQDAYEEAIQRTSTKIAPWFVIPSDDKLLARVLITRIILNKLKEMDPKFPKQTEQDEKFMKIARAQLESELRH